MLTFWKMHKNIFCRFFSSSALSAFLFCSLHVANFAFGNDLPDDLSDLSLEDLMDIEVTSVSKTPQKLANSAAAIFVITNEDIRRSGVTCIAEALRMAPGIQVARLSQTKWAISTRGFNGRFANKLLVLIDGRTVYSPLNSGVYWDIQDTMLEDIDRIEVIRGPGATLWGANAVNGVINVITKKSQDTQGTLLTAGFGDEERGFGSIRYGGRVGDLTFRLYGKYFDRDEAYADSHEANDSWNLIQGGFRADGQLTTDDTLTLQGDIYDTDQGQTVATTSLTPPYTSIFREEIDKKGGNLLLRWNRVVSEDSDLELQTYYDRTEQTEIMGEETRDSFDLNFQHSFLPGKSQEITWGLGYRFSRDKITPSFAISTSQTVHRTDQLYSAFVQDDITLIPERLHLILGSKLEHNNYTGYEIQPNGRILWTPNGNHSLWGAVARAVRTPSRFEHDGQIQMVKGPGENGNILPLPLLIRSISSSDFESEELIAYELGYRFLGLNDFSVDITAFYNDYDRLRTVELVSLDPDATPLPSHYISTSIFNNKMKSNSCGIEVVLNWHPFDWWSLQGVYSYFNMSLDIDSDSTDTLAKEIVGGDNPHHQASLRSSMDLPMNLQFDLWFRYVDTLDQQSIDAYLNMDMRLAWQPRKGLDLALVGQNLLDGEQAEYTYDLTDHLSTETQRSLYVKATWSF